MKLVIQRVVSAKISLHSSGEIVGKIGKGLFVLVGFKKGDTDRDVRALASKLLKLRVMSDPPLKSFGKASENGKMNKSVLDVQGEFLIVSQFTLYANTSGGNRPSFIDSLEPRQAQELYALFIDCLYEGSAKVATGSFGNYMDIEANLDGPVTITIES